MVDPAFIQHIQRGIAYWQTRAENLTDLTYHTAITDKQTLYKTIDHGLARPETAAAATTLLLSLHKYIEHNGFWHTWITRIQTALSHPGPQTKDSPYTPLLYCQLLNEQGFMHRLNSALPEAIASHEKAYELAQAYGLKKQVALTNGHLCNAYFDASDYEKAKAFGEQALAKVGDTKRTASLQNMLGLIDSRAHEDEKAILYFEQAVLLWSATDEIIYHALTLLNWGHSLVTLGETKAGFAKMTLARTLFEQTPSTTYMALAMLNNGVYLAEEGLFQEALPFLKQAYQLTRRGNHPLPIMGLSSMNLGVLLIYLKKPTEAISYLHEASLIWEKINDEPKLGNTLMELGKAIQDTDRAAAEAYWQRAKQLFDKHPNETWVKNWLEEWAALVEEKE